MRNVYLFLFLVVSCTLAAQQDSTSIASEKVEVVKRYQASILQSNRKEIPFQKEETSKAPLSFNYNLTGEKIIDFERPDPEIRPIGFKGSTEVRKKMLNGYVYGGYGAHKTLPAGAAYHYYIEDWIDAGFRIDHFSAESSKSIETLNGQFNSAYRDIQSSLYLGYHLGEQTKIRLEGDYDFNNRNVLVSDSTDLNVRKLGGDFTFDHNVFEDNGFAVRLGAGYHSGFYSLDNFKDNSFTGKLNLIKQVTETITAELPVSFVRTAVNDSLSVLDSTSFVDLILQPNVRFRGQNFNAKVGLEYITNDVSTFFFPIIDLSMDRVISILDLRIYTESEYRRNSMYNLVDDVPYMISAVADYSASYVRSYNINPSADYLNFTFGLNLAYRTYVNDFNPSATSQDFITSPLSLSGRYNLIYLDREEFRISPSVSWSNKENLSFNLQYNHNIFLTDSLGLFNKPSSTLSLTGEQKLLKSKLTFSQDLNLIGKRTHSAINNFGLIPVQELVVLSTYLDLGLGIKYRINDHIDISFRGVNLLQDNETVNIDSEVDYATEWLGYPILGRQFWGKLKLRF